MASIVLQRPANPSAKPPGVSMTTHSVHTGLPTIHILLPFPMAALGHPELHRMFYTQLSPTMMIALAISATQATSAEIRTVVTPLRIGSESQRTGRTILSCGKRLTAESASTRNRRSSKIAPSAGTQARSSPVTQAITRTPISWRYRSGYNRDIRI